MTDIDLDAIEARDGAATPGPWTVDYDWTDDDMPERYAYAINGPADLSTLCTSWLSDDYKRQYGHHMTEVAGISDADAEFIAHAREDVPVLAHEVRRLRTALQEVQTLRDEYRQSIDALAFDGRDVSVAVSETERRLTAILARAEQTGDEK